MSPPPVGGPMRPDETGQAYDRIAAWWDANEGGVRTGLSSLDKAIALCPRRGLALDVGCGTGGRLLARLLGAGFTVTGIDVSAGMLAHARRRHPHVRFVQADVTRWAPDARYDLVVAWDSTFHLPRDLQAVAVARMAQALAPGGVLLFTAGDRDGEVFGQMHGVPFEYGSLAPEAYAKVLADNGCRLQAAERDQPPEPHLAFLAVKPD